MKDGPGNLAGPMLAEQIPATNNQCQTGMLIVTP
jgi:hypothetical protein